MSEEFEQL